MPELPSGTVTFLFSDVELSTQTVATLGDERYADLQDVHRKLMREAFSAHGGAEVGTEGDSFFVAFARAGDALTAAVEGQRALECYAWPDDARLRVRIGLHTGEALLRGNDYIGHEVHRAKRICDAGHGGQVLMSETTRDLIGSHTPFEASIRELGSHRLKDLSEPQAIFQVVAEGLQADFPKLRTLEAVPHNLPVQLTSFVGRESELEEVSALLGRTRLLTITGAGGCGKTRLAIQLGAEIVDAFPGGVFLTDLAPLTDAAAVPQAVADAVGVPQGHGDAVVLPQAVEERLLAHLKGRRVLIILDNCEHLIDACADIATTILRGDPDAHIVVTTREPLGVAGETSWRLPSLGLPDVASPEMLATAEATRLFCDRAAQAVPSFLPNLGDAVAIVDICTRLDGIPLAIELAAARVRVLSCADIAKRLDDRFRLLTGGSRTAMPRQQTLRATVDWSHDLLTDEQQVLLRRLSVFAGGFTLDAIEDVCADERTPAEDLLDHLTALVDRSLVLVDQDRDGRYRLLDTVRHYAREKLVDANEGAILRDRHMRHFADLTRAGGTGLFGPESRTWLGKLDTEFANIRQAFEWALGEDPTASLQIVGDLADFWLMTMRTSEGRRWAEAALAPTDDVPSKERVRALRAAWIGLLGHQQGAETWTAAFEMAREIDDPAESAWLLSRRAVGLVAFGRLEQGRSSALEALELAERAGAISTASNALRTLATAASLTGDTEAARGYLRRAMENTRLIGDKHDEALVEAGLGTLARNLRDYELARKHFEQSLALGAEHGCRNCLGGMQTQLAWLARGRGDHAEATRLAAGAMRIVHEDRITFFVYFTLGTFAMIAYDVGDHDRAARLLGAIDTIRADAGFSFAGGPAEAEQRRIDRVREALGAEAFDEAFVAGQKMNQDEAVAYALEGAENVRS
jgi:predicted ATPase/class 3 adenylate cyclase